MPEYEDMYRIAGLPYLPLGGGSLKGALAFNVVGTSSPHIKANSGYGPLTLGKAAATSQGLDHNGVIVGKDLEVKGTAYLGANTYTSKFYCLNHRLNGGGDIGADATGGASARYIRIRSSCSTSAGQEAAPLAFFAGYNSADVGRYAPVMVVPSKNLNPALYAAAFTNQADPVFAVFSHENPLTTTVCHTYTKHTGTQAASGHGVVGTGQGDLQFSPASGFVRFGTHAAIAAETVTGYITINDAAGNARKIAVVS